MRTALVFFVVAWILLAPACTIPPKAKMPETMHGATLEFSTEKGRLKQVRTTVNKVGAVPERNFKAQKHSPDGNVVLYFSPEFEPQADILLDYFVFAYKYITDMQIRPLASMRLAFIQEAQTPAKWRGVLVDGTLHCDIYYTGTHAVKEVGKWKRLDDFVASQLLGIFHELIEAAFMFGDGVAIGYGDESKLRWLREGLSTYLAEQSLKRFFVCNPFKGSQLEHKYHYVSQMGAELLDWRETSGAGWERGYAASLGLMGAAYDATGGRFPSRFLGALAQSGTHDSNQCVSEMEKVLGCSVRQFISSIRRPLPDLICAEKLGRLAIPTSYSTADAPGLKPRDEILAVNGRRITTHFEMDETLWGAGALEEFIISVKREDEVLDVLCRPYIPRHCLERANK